jgi:hypothetical protein
MLSPAAAYHSSAATSPARPPPPCSFPQGAATSIAQLERQLAALGSLQRELPQAQFVALAGAMHSADYTATVHLLHRYYDYDQAGAGASLAAPGSVGTHYQSGLLSLTSAHAAFGHVESALLVTRCCWACAARSELPCCGLSPSRRGPCRSAHPTRTAPAALLALCRR